MNADVHSDAVPDKEETKPATLAACLLLFALIAAPITAALLLFVKHNWLFFVLLFMLGWFYWTFIEYAVHRFYLHRKNNPHYAESNHFLHHRHPTHIYNSALKRVVITASAATLVLLSFLRSPALFFPAGFAVGYAFYGYIHILLHRPLAGRWFGKLQQFHIQHHCKKVESCFGVTVTWWDILFKTTPERQRMSQDVVRFYFNTPDHAGEKINNLTDEIRRQR